MSINYNEKQAITDYTEFLLLAMCEQLEQSVDTQTAQQLYSYAYDVLNDLDDTLQQRVDTVALQQFVDQNWSQS